MEKFLVVPTSKYEAILEQLSSIVGSRYVSNKPEELFLYKWDFFTITTPPGRCDFVVLPGSTEEVQEIVKLAAREKIPVVPMVSGLQNAGMANPREGGIVIDLRRMNKVLEVNEDDMYALVEGGITWGDLRNHLEKHYPHLKAGYTWSPAGTGVIPCYIEYGMLDISLVAGCGAEFINGLEVVLPTGEVVTTGTAAWTGQKYWLARGPGPDLTGLFVGWAGGNGIVTKASIKLWPTLPRADFLCIADTYERGIEIEKKLIKAGGPLLGLVDLADLNQTWTAAAAGFCGFDLKTVPFEAEKAGLPDFYALFTLVANTEKEMEAKAEVVYKIVEETGGKLQPWEDFEESTPINARGETPTYVSMTPQQIQIWYFYQGGLGEWIGGYFPVNKVPEFYKEARKVAVKYGKHALNYHRALFGGHYHIDRVLIETSKDDPEDFEKTKKCLLEIDEVLRKCGGVRYKPQYWSWRRTLTQTDATTVELARKIRKLLDPNGIMNPGQGLE